MDDKDKDKEKKRKPYTKKPSRQSQAWETNKAKVRKERLNKYERKDPGIPAEWGD